VIIQSEPGPVILATAHPEGFQELGRLPALSSKDMEPADAGRAVFAAPERPRGGVLRTGDGGEVDS